MPNYRPLWLTVSSLAILTTTATIQAESNIRKRTSNGQRIPSERDQQEATFNRYFEPQQLRYLTEYSTLKKSASVEKWRIPYTASIHPERSGGLSAAGSGAPVLRKYDQAFNGGRALAYPYDRARKTRVGVRYGLFGGGRTYTYSTAEHWEGYCSGFTASTIMHPEPVRPVDAGKVGGRAGVIFQPADIKALLAAAYNRTRSDSYLMIAPPSSRYGGPNMGTWHLALCNYLGQAGHAVGIDRTKGRVSWNNPIYKYQVVSERDAGSRGDIHYKLLTTKITYAWYGRDDTAQTNPQTGERQNLTARSMNVRYYLELDKDDKIIGGRALSHEGHFLWIPLYAVQGIRDQTSPGNPHVEVARIIALARQSALPEAQNNFDQVVIGKMVDPKIAIRAKERRLRLLAELKLLTEKAERERKEREARTQALAEQQQREPEQNTVADSQDTTVRSDSPAP